MAWSDLAAEGLIGWLQLANRLLKERVLCMYDGKVSGSDKTLYFKWTILDICPKLLKNNYLYA